MIKLDKYKKIAWVLKLKIVNCKKNILKYIHNNLQKL